jgi:hypothetical protein
MSIDVTSRHCIPDFYRGAPRGKKIVEGSNELERRRRSREVDEMGRMTRMTQAAFSSHCFSEYRANWAIVPMPHL